MSRETPLMMQYKEIKDQNRDSILFFRLGDFYEMFFDDAVIASKELGLTLTSRNKEKDQEVPLAGIPYHSAAGYISKLVKKGYKVAICEQVEDPKTAKGIVKREVVRVITPGTVIDLDYIDAKSNNYLLGFVINKMALAISYLDITTGEFKTTELVKENGVNALLNEINKVAPTEILTDEDSYELCKKELDFYLKQSEISLTMVKRVKKSADFLRDYFGVVSLESFGLLGKDYSIDASGMVLQYVLDLQKYSDIPVNKISYINKDLFVKRYAFGVIEHYIQVVKKQEKVGEKKGDTLNKFCFKCNIFHHIDSSVCSCGNKLTKIAWLQNKSDELGESECIRCGTKRVTPFKMGNEAMQSIIAMVIYQKLLYKEENRRLITFADSRKDSAFFPIAMKRNFDIFKSRADIYRLLKDKKMRLDSISDFVLDETENKTIENIASCWRLEAKLEDNNKYFYFYDEVQDILDNKKLVKTENSTIKCPHCGSEQIVIGKRGFSIWTGFIGANKTENRCGNCGYHWFP